MKRIICAVAGVVIAAAVTVVPVNRTEAHAATNGAICAANLEWSFNPPLTPTLGLGSANTTFNNICVNVMGAATGLSFPSGTAAQNYFGSCLTATLSGDNNGVIIGGTVAIITSPFVQAYVLVPLLPCNEAAAPSVGVTG